MQVFGRQHFTFVQITSDHMCLSERQAAGASNGESNRELAAIKRAYNLAIKDENLGHMPHIPMLAEASPRKGFFERSQFESVRWYPRKTRQGDGREQDSVGF
jgi:hypothetical protein